MLYDKRWERKLDVDSIESLIAWLETKPAESPYEYADGGLGTVGCILCQYYRAMGVPVWAMYENHRRANPRERVRLPPHFNEVAMGGHTFGDALAVARRLSGSPREAT